MQLTTLFSLLAIAGAANAWTLELCKHKNYRDCQVEAGTGNYVGYLSPGMKDEVSSFKWDRATRSSCCVSFYDGGKRIGYSCSDWSKSLMSANDVMDRFEVTNC